MAGLVFLFRQEIAARIELAVVGLAFLWFLALGRPLVDFLILGVLGCILFAVEALNTAVEEVVDKISPERSEFGKNAKDLGSTAVFCMLTAGGLYVAAVTAEAWGLLAL